MVEGYSPERFLNLCNVNSIVIWGVENRGGSYQLYVAVKDFKKLRPFARKTGTKISILEKQGVPFFLYKFRKRKMFFIGIIMCTVLTWILSLFVWNIHFEGNETQSTGELLSYLEELGVIHGIQKSKIICEEIETNLRTKYPNMLWVSAELRGTRIIVQIKENTDKDIVSNMEIKKNDPASIVSEYSGIVKTMIVRQGTPRVKEGEEVSAGQTLVDGYYEIKNDAGEIVRYESVFADADIVLLVEESYEDSFSSRYMEKVYSDKKRLGGSVYLFDKKYQFVPSLPYDKYDIVEKYAEIHITENFYLPIAVETVWYLEYEEFEKNHSKNEINEIAEERFLGKYENILQKGVQIIEKNVRIDTNGKLCHVTGTVQLSVPVDTKVPVVLPDTAKDASLEGEN